MRPRWNQGIANFSLGESDDKRKDALMPRRRDQGHIHGHKPVLYLNGNGWRDWAWFFGTEAFLELLYAVFSGNLAISKNNSTSLWNFVPNSRLGQISLGYLPLTIANAVNLAQPVIIASLSHRESTLWWVWHMQQSVLQPCLRLLRLAAATVIKLIWLCEITAIIMVRSHTHTTVLLLFWNMSGTTQVSRYQKGKTKKVKTNLDLLEQEIVSGSGICWAMCKSAPHPRQPRQHPTTQFFTGRMPFLPPNQQRQSIEGTVRLCYWRKFNEINYCITSVQLI